ncbi:MAG: hypothetical protein Q8J70_10070, partial [Thiobacillus sp.]|nr:hypothetical protein [Thiobacillus sp.]
MKQLLLISSLSLVVLPVYGADALPPLRVVAQNTADDLPPPRTTTRKPRPASSEVGPAETAPQASSADDLPPPPTTSSRKPRARGFRPTLKYGVDDLLLETGGLPDAAEADTYSTLR